MTPAQILTGELLPGELVSASWFTAWKIDILWLTICLALAAFYIFGVYRLRKRGDAWPVYRTVSWLLGLGLLFYITNGAMNVYEHYLFSVHMIAHMMLTMAVPIFLVPGAPVTLLSRAAVKRHDESRGIREWVLWAVHTPWARFFGNPLVSAIMFASSLIVFYFTPIFGWATRDHLGHEWMIVHFLITGYLFVQSLIGADPGPKLASYPIRLMVLILTLTFHAFFGLALMQGQSLLLADWFGAMGRTWGDTPLGDQQTGGAIAWGIGEIPSAVLTIIVSRQWFKADTREQVRVDRASDRSGNQDIEDYNAMLAKLAGRKEER
jgi:putative copper resistance protein D